MKNAIVVLIFISAALFAYVTLQPQFGSFERGEATDEGTFLSTLIDSPVIYIVMDLRGVEDDSVRTNIMQCGVDFAGGTGLAGRNVTYMSMDETQCVHASIDEGVKGTITPDECLEMLNGGMSLYIVEGVSTTYYTKAAMVGVNESYEIGMCGITAS